MPPTRLLDNYYTTVVTLLEYLSRATKQPAVAFTREDDDESFTKLLHSTLIALDYPLADIPHFEAHQPMISQTDVSRLVDMSPGSDAKPKIIDRVQQRLLATANGRSNNVLTLGYRSVSHCVDQILRLFPTLLQADLRAETGKVGRTTVFNFFVNTMVSVLRSYDWCLLLQRYESRALPENKIELRLLSSVGEDAMLGLLSGTSIFLQLPNGCLCQATGKPMCALRPRTLNPSISPSNIVPMPVELASNLKRKQPPVVSGDIRPYKRRRVALPQETKRYVLDHILVPPLIIV